MYLGFRAGSVVKNSPTSAGDVSSIPGSRRSPGEGINTYYHSLILCQKKIEAAP